ncbi:MFS transporter [Methylobacterium nonmethylotrophicum]|nr:MFS transporter [Methylobacterium nonmethylotrophicum]
MAHPTVLPCLSVGERLDRLPVTPKHWRIFWLLTAGLFIDSTEIFLGGGVAAALLRDGWSTLELNAAFHSFTFLGMAIGALGCGILSDRYGRRFAFQFTLLIFGVASFAAAAAPSMGWIIAFRFIMGVGLGGELVVTYSTLTEFIPARLRGRFLALLVIFGGSTLFVASLMSYLVIPSFGWRPCFAAIGVAALLLWRVRSVMPESPRWLAENGRRAEAEAVTRDLEGPHYQPCVPAFELHAAQGARASFADLFRHGMAARTLATASISVAVNIALYSFTNWIPTFLVKQGSSITFSLGLSTLMTAGAPVGAAVAFFISDRFGRKPLIITGLILAALAGALYPTARSVEAAVTYGFLLNGLLYFLVAVGVTGYSAEVFPTACRLRGVGFVSMSARVAAMLCPYAVVPLFQWGGVAAVIGVVAAILFVVPVLVWRWCVEPTGLSLEVAASTTTDAALKPGLALAEDRIG